MNKYRSMLIFVACLILVASFAGCKKAPKDGGLVVGPDGVIGGIDGDPYSIGLGDERGLMSQYSESDFTPVYFEYDSSHVSPQHQMAVEAVADHLRSNPNQGVIVEGHCDERGSREYNMALGERRALAVRAYLIGLGIEPARVQTRSMGEESPSALGHDENSWRQNRRAEFFLFE
jgi:peptidoglycan-associated lipoprotein